MLKAIKIALAGTAMMAATGVAAQTTTSYTFSSTVAADANRVFSGSFSLSENAGVFSLAAFSGSYNGYTYNLGNTGLNQSAGSVLIGGTLNRVNTVIGNTNDFFFGYFNPGSTSTILVVSREGLGTNPSATLSISQVVTGAVPEPATWALMILGFGATGFAMRRRQKIAARVSLAG